MVFNSSYFNQSNETTTLPDQSTTTFATPAPPAITTTRAIQVFLYFITGLVIFSGNSLLSLSTWKFRALRSNKGYMVFSFMFMCDALNGLALFSSAVHRSVLVFQGRQGILQTRQSCFLHLHSVLWTFFDLAAPLMLAVISLDRLHLVTHPSSYLASPVVSYTLIAAAMFCGSVATGVVVARVWAADRNATLHPNCNFPSTVGGDYYPYHSLINFLAAVASIVLFVLVILVNRHRQRRLGNEESPMTKTQKKLTRMVGFSCLATLLLYVIPRICITLVNYLSFSFTVRSNIQYSLFLTTNFNAIINSVIFLRDPVIQKGVSALLRCKTMPATLNLWIASKAPPAQVTQPTLKTNDVPAPPVGPMPPIG